MFSCSLVRSFNESWTSVRCRSSSSTDDNSRRLAISSSQQQHRHEVESSRTISLCRVIRRENCDLGVAHHYGLRCVAAMVMRWVWEELLWVFELSCFVVTPCACTELLYGLRGVHLRIPEVGSSLLRVIMQFWGGFRSFRMHFFVSSWGLSLNCFDIAVNSSPHSNSVRLQGL